MPYTDEIQKLLADALERMDGFVAQRSMERLSGGASQETYRLRDSLALS